MVAKWASEQGVHSDPHFVTVLLVVVDRFFLFQSVLVGLSLFVLLCSSDVSDCVTSSLAQENTCAYMEYAMEKHVNGGGKVSRQKRSIVQVDDEGRDGQTLQNYEQAEATTLDSFAAIKGRAKATAAGEAKT